MKVFDLDYGSVQVLDNAVPTDLYKELLIAAYRRIGWQFGWNTPSNRENRYWHHEVGRGGKNNIEDCSGIVYQHPVRAFGAYQDWLLNNLVPQETRVLRFYLNAHTFGTDGWPHTDTDRTDELTMVLYLTESWKPEWCGETVVFDDNDDIVASTLPRQNRIMIFPSNYLHSPRPLSKVFQGMRVVLVTKMGSATGKSEGLYRHDDPQEQPHVQLMQELNAHTTQHSGRTLLQHLLGVYRLLKRRGMPEDLCLAGLYHSVYGTSVFGDVTTNSRETIKAKIGEDAERLAWLFSQLNRPECWSRPGLSLPDKNGGLIELSENEKAKLILLENANLDEQGIVSDERARTIRKLVEKLI